MSREQNVPLLLWISAALLAHIATGGGADRIARVLDDRAKLHAFADSVRAQLRAEDETIEIDFVEDAFLEAQPDPSPNDEKADDPVAPPPPDEKRAEAEPPKPPAPTPPNQAQVEPSPTATPPTPPPPPQQDRRIAVRQHAKPDQEDNPNANYIADEANKVEQETVAEITSRDQDDPNPTPGVEHSGPSERPGNSDEHRVADSQDRAGDPERAPGEASDDPPLEEDELPKTAKVDPPPSPPEAPQAPPPAARAAGGAKAPPAEPSGAAEPPSPMEAPEVVASSEAGAYRLDPGRPASARKKPDSPPDPKQGPRLGLGLGSAGSTSSGINLNLSQQGVIAAVGEDTLTRERRADGERRRSAHRGSFKPSQFERWRAAIENYVSAVKPGNQTALNTARVPFATYLNTIHNRIHPIFADDFLLSLDRLPAGHPLNEPKLMTRLEIVLDRDDGRVVRMGVLRTSGVTAFDIAALDSVQRASPFGKPPSVIVSKDGNVYFHWEFHRNPMYACSTMNARPYMLTTPAPSEPGPKTPAPIIVPGGDPREQGIPNPPVPASREGSLPSPALAPTTPKRS